MNTLSRNHRTALFVEVSSDSTPEFQERAARLVASLGGPGNGTERSIKVDTYSVNVATGEVSRGLNFPTEAPAVEALDYERLAREAGYSQTVISRQTQV